jgi:hypothetical protein
VATTGALDTPEAIANHVHAELLWRTEAAALKSGVRVRITQRHGIPLGFMIGDVGMVTLCDSEFSPLTTRRGRHRNDDLVLCADGEPRTHPPRPLAAQSACARYDALRLN